MKKGVLSAMRNATREPFAHGCVLGIGLAKMRCIILYGRGPSHGSISYYCSLQFWLVKRQSALCALYRSTRTGRVGHLAGRIAGGGHAQVMRRGRSHPLLARALWAPVKKSSTSSGLRSSSPIGGDAVQNSIGVSICGEFLMNTMQFPQLWSE